MAHGDFTGMRKADLAQRFAQQQALAAQSQTLVTQVVEEGRREVIDLMTEEDLAALHPTAPNPDGSGEVIEVDVQDPLVEPVKFRAREDCDDVTIGKDRQFNLKEGQVYRAPRWVVEHLDRQTLVYH